MRGSSIYACLLASAAILIGSAGFAQGILDDPTLRQLEGQDINANDDLIEALRRAALRGPIFRITPDRLAVSMEVGTTGSSDIRITNTGDQTGTIRDISILGTIDGLVMTTTCEQEIIQGDFCVITVSYTSDRARDIKAAIVGTINEVERATFEIPVSFSVDLPPPPPPVPVTPVPVVSLPAVPVGPQPRDIARVYFGAIGGGMSSPRGFTIVSAPKPALPEGNVAGVNYADIEVNTVTFDKRYDPAIPSTKAGLPVNRDNILTMDRVIKAVLETPVSNVMCNKVVALVESDVYSATSRRPLIQAGSRVVGQCQNFADERVGIAWTRIITTDGRSILFKDRVADTNDATGLGGVPGRIYMSPFDKYVIPIFSTMIDTAAGVIFATFGEDEGVVIDEFGNQRTENSATNEGLRIITGEARTTAQSLLRDIQDVREIAVIPKGSRIDIEIQEDIYFQDDREVITLAEMRYDLAGLEDGYAQRDVPSEITLVPVEANYTGEFVVVGGVRYRISATTAAAPSMQGAGSPQAGPASQSSPAVRNDPSRQTLDELSRIGTTGGSN